MINLGIALLVILALCSGTCSLLAFVFPLDASVVTIGWTALAICLSSIGLIVYLDSSRSRPSTDLSDLPKSTLAPSEDKDMWQ